MKITNPTKEKIEGVQIGINTYSIEAEGTLDNVPEVDARYWQENIHKFLILRKDKLEDVVSKEIIVEIPTPKVEEVKEEIDEEVKEEEPIIEVKDEVIEEVKEEIVVAKKTNKKK